MSASLTWACNNCSGPATFEVAGPRTCSLFYLVKENTVYKASKLINYEGMVTLYCSLFLPYLTYCCEIWGNTYATNVNCIYVIQKKVVRIIHHEERLAHTNCLFKLMHSLKFHDIYC